MIAGTLEPRKQYQQQIGSVGSAFNSNTSVRTLKRRSIVNTVTSHGDKVSPLLQNFDYIVLVLREHLSKPISSLDKVINFRSTHVTTSTKT